MNTPMRTLGLVALSILVACGNGGTNSSAPKPAPVNDAQKPKAPEAPADPIAEVDAYLTSVNVNKSAPDWRTSLRMPPKLRFDAQTDYFWHLDTSAGAIKIRLFADTAPIHVSSCFFLTRLGFYDGLNFHRIVPGFMAQGGDPLGTGAGGPGYQFGGEFQGGRKHDRPGILSMAHAGAGTDGSQFFLTFVPTPHLDNRHTVWGEVVEGMETVKALEKLGSPSAPNGAVANPPLIKKATVSAVKKG